MQSITEIELSGYSELLNNEENAVKKFQCYAETCEDPALKKLCRQIAGKHAQHYKAVLSEMKK